MEVQIIDMDHKGNGISKLDNKVIFIPKGITGDTCDISIYKNYKNYDIGKINEITKNSDLRKYLSSETIVLGPSMANVFKINNVYHYQCIIKYKYDDKLNKVLTKLDEIYKVNNKVDISIDVNPIRV